MDAARPQTAIQGVAHATALNLVSRLLNFARQILITAYFGLTLRLDAFYVAAALAAIFINTFGDVFDSAGIPVLVRTREKEGPEAFRRLCGSVFTLSLALGGGLTAAMVLASPLARFLVPGFSVGSLRLVYENLFLLVPFGLAYLPYHCLGSFFRSVREFRVFYVGELLVMATALVVVVLGRDSIRAVPLSFSVGYPAGLLLFLVRARGRFRFWGRLEGDAMALVGRTLARMLPIYGLAYGLVIVEKCFGSFLEPGAISALSYGAILATTVPAVMNIENVFITPLAEESDRGELLTRIFSGIAVVSVPILAFLLVFADDLVRVLFERGAFTSRAADLTAEALRFYALGIPALFVLPLCVRSLQVVSSLRWVGAMGALGLVLCTTLNLLFVAMGHRSVWGIALAASVSTTATTLLGLWSVSWVGIRVRYRETFGVLPGVLAATGAGLGLALAFHPGWHPIPEFVARGVGFVFIYVVLALWMPGSEMDRIRALFLESFPWLRVVVPRR